MSRNAIGVLAGLFGVAAAAGASDYVALMATEAQRCAAISPSEAQSGLAFNPDGYKSFYVQSECFQRAAVQFRDLSLCERVRRRESILWSSWGVSSKHCRELVSGGIAEDRAAILKEKQQYATGPIRLQSFRVERNGNGRDFDFIPAFSKGNAHGYGLIFELMDTQRGPILLHSDGYYVDANSSLRIFVRQADIRARYPEFTLNRAYKVRATMIFSMGMGGPSGYWSDGFLESIFPLRERSQSVVIETKF